MTSPSSDPNEPSYEGLLDKDPEDVTIVSIKAPKDMNAGFQFYCIHDGMPFVVTVPPGGVTMNQTFSAPFNEESRRNAKTEEWSDGICSWSSHFLSCCVASFCPMVLMGQVMTRMQLTMFATTSSNPSPDTCRNVTGLLLGLTILGFVLTLAFAKAETKVETKIVNGRIERYGKAEKAFGNELLNLPTNLALLLLLVFVFKTRGIVRQRYNIAGSWLGDCCISWWCTCCAVAQLARQTSEYEVNTGDFLSNTGNTIGIV